MEKLMKKLAALVGVFSHSAVNNDEFKDIQTESLEEGFDNASSSSGAMTRGDLVLITN